MSTIDPLVKGICRCTNSTFKTEHVAKDDGTKEVSKGSQDYGLFRIENLTAMLLIIWEAKKESMAENVIAQTIGYFIASNIHVERHHTGSDKLKPAMGLVTSQSKCRFFFSPFKTNDDLPCLDALVSNEFPLMKNSFLNLDIFGFIIKYIHYFDEVVCGVPSSIPCNPKATYTPFVQLATLTHWELQRKLEELEKQRDEQLKMEKPRDEQLRKMEEQWDKERTNNGMN